MSKPNIIFILADDMGYGDLSCFNYGASSTPRLDTLVGEGVCLSQQYSASPICAPARAALLSGRYPQRSGVIDTITAGEMNCMATREITIADIFKASGYQTGMIGKWHTGGVLDKYHPNQRGFDDFMGFRGGGSRYFDWNLEHNGKASQSDGRYLTDVFTSEAQAFISRNRKKPFFLHLAYNAPHGPFEACDEDLKPFLEPGNFTKGVATVYAMIKRMDEGIGRVLDTLDREGLRENTIVVFTSDNGPQMTNRPDIDCRRFNCGFRGSKGSVYEGGIRVPLVIRWPAGLQGQQHFHDLVHFTDWLPTLVTMACIDCSETLPLDGIDVLPVLRGEGAKKMNPKRFWQFSRSVPLLTHNAAMRDGDWKLVRPGHELANSFEGWREDLAISEEVKSQPANFTNGVPDASGRSICLDHSPEKPLLFNLASDPLEMNDLSSQEPERLSKMMSELENWFDDVEKDRKTIPERQFRNAATFE